MEEEEETYDDIERATTPPRPGPASVPATTQSLGQTPQSSREEWKDQTGTQEDEEEEEEDIYEELPGIEKTWIGPLNKNKVIGLSWWINLHMCILLPWSLA